MKNKSLKALTTVSILVALTIVIRMNTPILPLMGRIEFAKVFSQLIPIIFGPLLGGISAAIADIIGWTIRGGGMFLWQMLVLEVATAVGIALMWRYIKLKTSLAKLFLIIPILDIIYVSIRTWVLIDIGIIPAESFWLALSPRLISTLIFVIPKIFIMFSLINVYEKYIKKESAL